MSESGHTPELELGGSCGVCSITPRSPSESASGCGARKQVLADASDPTTVFHETCGQCAMCLEIPSAPPLDRGQRMAGCCRSDAPSMALSPEAPEDGVKMQTCEALHGCE